MGPRYKIEFCIIECAMLTMKWRKRETTEGIALPDQKNIGTHGEKENYKYLKILEVDIIKQMEMKEKVRNEYLRSINFLKPNYVAEIKGIVSLKIPWIFLKMEKRGTQSYGLYNKEIDGGRKRRRRGTCQHWGLRGDLSVRSRRIRKKE